MAKKPNKPNTPAPERGLCEVCAKSIAFSGGYISGKHGGFVPALRPHGGIYTRCKGRRAKSNVDAEPGSWFVQQEGTGALYGSSNLADRTDRTAAATFHSKENAKLVADNMSVGTLHGKWVVIPADLPPKGNKT